MCCVHEGEPGPRDWQGKGGRRVCGTLVRPVSFKFPEILLVPRLQPFIRLGLVRGIPSCWMKRSSYHYTQSPALGAVLHDPACHAATYGLQMLRTSNEIRTVLSDWQDVRYEAFSFPGKVQLGPTWSPSSILMSRLVRRQALGAASDV